MICFLVGDASWRCLFLRVGRRILVLRLASWSISCLRVKLRFDMPARSLALLKVARDLISILSSGSRRPAKVVPINGLLLSARFSSSKDTPPSRGLQSELRTKQLDFLH